MGNRFASTKRSLESPDWTTPVISFDEKYPVGKRMNASVYVWVCQSDVYFWVWPRNSDHQEYSMFSRESRHKPSFTTNIPGRGVRKPKVYRKKDDEN